MYMLTKGGHFWTTYLPRLVNVICEWPLILNQHIDLKSSKIHLSLPIVPINQCNNMETTDDISVPGDFLFTFVYSIIKFWAITFDQMETEMWQFYYIVHWKRQNSRKNREIKMRIQIWNWPHCEMQTNKPFMVVTRLDHLIRKSIANGLKLPPENAIANQWRAVGIRGKGGDQFTLFKSGRGAD